MPLEITAIGLCIVALAVVVMMLLIALAAIADPTTITRCHDCSRWIVDTVHRSTPVCFRCRHSHHSPAHLPSHEPGCT
jgi:hypothetical protein